MNHNRWQVEIIKSWQDAQSLHGQWDALASSAAEGHPFLCHDWFSFWYPAFAPAEGIRILLLRQGDGKLRAIFPGFLEKRRLGGLWVRCFSYAANGYSPYGGIIARAGDHEAIRRILLAAVEQVRPVPHLLVLPGVLDSSDTAAVIRGNELTSLGRRIEHAEEVPVFAMPLGWESYYGSRSANTRKRNKKKYARICNLGKLNFEEFSTVEHSVQVVDRLQRLDALTWQGRQGTGLFSNAENDLFYRELLSFRYPSLALKVYLATVGDQDVAYSLTASSGSTLYALKTGYDPCFSACSPGSLTMFHVGERAAVDGMKQVDLGAGTNEDKRAMLTHCNHVANWWLPYRCTLYGCALEMMLILRGRFKLKKKPIHE